MAAQILPISTGMIEIPHKMRLKAVWMTPTVAAEILKNNHPNNRKQKDSRINKYSQEIANGLWILTHEGVAIDENGYLIDGQNRLEAIVLADKPAPILLITGVPENALLATDQGLNRSVADIAKVTGQDRSKMTTWVSVTRAMLAGTRGTHQYNPSHQEILLILKRHEQAIQFAMELTPKNAVGLTQASVRAVLARSFYQPKKYHPRIKEFVDVFLTGLMENVNTDSAAIRLRNWLLDNFSQGTRKRLAGTRPKQTIVFGKMQSALKAFIEERNIEILRETSEDLFPLPE